MAAEPVEIDLVEHDRAGAVQLFALEAAIDDRRQVRVGERRGKPGLDHVQRANRDGIVVLVMRPDQPLGQAGQLGGIELERADLMVAGKGGEGRRRRSEETTSELQSLRSIQYAVF